ncbi:UNVERIFIED_CONTAM: hypothetical protein PYX00_000303 [Menopon gallinae]|uniref:tryptophan--tRNA ligase n=1 Tax=Menopon gallinae TaxID=328185 RepID=A0AAW2I7Y1_9NEOP
MYSSLRQRSVTFVLQRNFSQNSPAPKFPRQVFSAIQPTGEAHLGNYLGAIKKWIKLQNTEPNVIFSIADLHSLSVSQSPDVLCKNIQLMAATLLACGIDPKKAIFFQQSSVHQHSELYWILGTLATMARLSHLPQFKEKTQNAKEIPVGIFMYPILQAADIALYKTTHVPIGQDQIQHIELANYVLKAFNRNFGYSFPKVTALVDETSGSIKSLTQPSKKMSKSGLPKSCIYLRDSPEDILEKCKKAVTDFNSQVTYEPETRPGVSNLVVMHSELTGKPPDTVCQEIQNLNTGDYKLLLADIIIEALKPIRQEINRYLTSPEYLENILQSGAEKASEIAENTMKEVKSKMGLNGEVESSQKIKREAR